MRYNVRRVSASTTSRLTDEPLMIARISLGNPHYYGLCHFYFVSLSRGVRVRRIVGGDQIRRKVRLYVCV